MIERELMKKELLVRRIENGTVVDHIPAGAGLRVAAILNLDSDEDCFVVIGNVLSSKLGKKDIVKLENRELTRKEIDKISLIAPEATLNVVRNSLVVQKMQLEIPDSFQEIIKCPNTNCITNFEHATTKFVVEAKQPLKIRCHYCERLFGADEISS